MIVFSSGIGFFIVFLAISIASSIVLTNAYLVSARALSSFGAKAERRASAAAIILPPILAAGVTLSLVARSALGSYFGLVDHCAQHLHHLHLCVFHGGSWADHGWAVALTAAAGTWLAIALLRALHLQWSAHLGLLRIAELARPEQLGAHTLWIAPAGIPFCFAAGVFRTRIFVSTAAWSRWNEAEKRAALEHEIAHLRSKDLLYRSLFGLCAVFGAPYFTRRVLDLYDDATERFCDRRAAVAVGDATVVASALLACARREPPIVFCASFLSSSSIERRIEALLEDVPEAEKPAKIITSSITALTAMLLLAAAVFADPLHHLLESIFG